MNRIEKDEDEYDDDGNLILQVFTLIFVHIWMFIVTIYGQK